MSPLVAMKADAFGVSAGTGDVDGGTIERDGVKPEEARGTRRGRVGDGGVKPVQGCQAAGQ